MASTKNPAAVALGRLGGKARLTKMTPEERSRIARLGGLARHGKVDDSQPDPEPTGTEPSKVRSLADAAKKRGRKLASPEPPMTAREAGRRGGRARAESLTQERRTAIAQAAARARWDESPQSSSGRWVAEACRQAAANDGQAYAVAA
jgi:general stress protein YciG